MNSNYTNECQEVMNELKRFERRYDDKVQEYELDKQANTHTLHNLAHDMSSLKGAAEGLSEALISHMKDEEKHHIAVATTLTKIETSLESRPTHKDLGITNQELEKHKGRITTIWVIGSVVVSAALIIMSMTAVYVKDDLVKTIEKSSKIHYKLQKSVLERDDKGKW